MIHHIFVLKVNAGLPTSHLKRGNVQAVVIEQPQTPTSTLSCQENAESAQVMGYDSDMLTVQLQRHVQQQDELAVLVLREGVQALADRIQVPRYEVQLRARLTVLVLREGLQTPVKSLQERPRQTLTRRRRHFLNLSLHREHDENSHGTGHPLHYRVHPKALVLL